MAFRSTTNSSILKTIRLLNAERRLRYVPTFLGAHEVPDEYRGEIDDYVDLVIHEMLPAVAEDNLAEYCDVFCEPNVFPARTGAHRSCAPPSRWAFACASTPTSSAPITAPCSPPNSAPPPPTTWNPPPPPGSPRSTAAGVQPVLLAGVGLQPRLHALPRRPRHDRSAACPWCSPPISTPASSPTASMPLVLSLASTQMKMTPAESITAVTINAAHSLGRGQPDRFARTRQGRRFRHPRLRRLSRTPLLLRPRPRPRRLSRRPVRLPPQRLNFLQPLASYARPLYWYVDEVWPILHTRGGLRAVGVHAVCAAPVPPVSGLGILQFPPSHGLELIPASGLSPASCTPPPASTWTGRPAIAAASTGAKATPTGPSTIRAPTATSPPPSIASPAFTARTVEQPINLDEDDDVFNYPWLYAVEVGHWELTDSQIDKFREYLMRGGFFMCDDFHASNEWEVFIYTMQKVFPDRPIVDIPDERRHLPHRLRPGRALPGPRHAVRQQPPHLRKGRAHRQPRPLARHLRRSTAA